MSYIYYNDSHNNDRLSQSSSPYWILIDGHRFYVKGGHMADRAIAAIPLSEKKVEVFVCFRYSFHYLSKYHVLSCFEIL